MAYCWLSLLVSFSSKAYEQQYNVGDTGPNGGTITSVTVESILSDSTTELVGDFEETTYTYVYTETVVEDVQTTNQITTTTYETVEETTENIIDVYDSASSGIVLDHTSHFHTDYQGGQITYSTDLGDYLTEEEIQYGFSATASADVSACENQIGGHCTSGNLDTFSISIKVIDPTTGEDYMKTTTWSVGYSWQNYSTTLDVSANTLSSDSQFLATYYGIDNGYWAGWYGPVVNNMDMSITYDAITSIITTIDQIVTSQIETSLTTTEYEYNSVYIPPVFDSIDIAPVEVLADFTIEIKTFDNMVTMDFEIMETDTGEMQMEITTFENDMEVDVEVVDIDMESMVEEMDAPVEIEVAENESDSESAQESDMEEESKEEQKDSQSTSVKEKLAQKIVERVVAQGDQVAINNVKLAVMAQLTETEAFAQYEAKQIVDNNFEVFMQEPLEDPYAIMYDMGNDYLMEQMVNQQWQN